MSLPIPHPHSIAHATGSPAGVSIPVNGITAGDVLLAVISWAPAGGPAAGEDPAAFTVADGAIISATVDLDGLRLLAIFGPDR